MLAITRAVPDSLGHCQLTHIERAPIDIARAREQHAAYEKTLARVGCEVVGVPATHDLPDSVFIEDTAIVLDELAVITRPGAASRRPETAAVASTLGAFRQLAFLSEPATLDGGDVLRLGRTLYVGMGSRTNAAGVRQLTELVAPHGYDVRPIRVDDCLHLKSAITEVAPGIVVLNPAWVDARMFADQAIIEVDPSEPPAANVVRAGNAVLCSESFPRTRARIEAAGIATHAVDLSELAKAEGALTCCSLLFAR
jgi:dimethylargininase